MQIKSQAMVSDIARYYAGMDSTARSQTLGAEASEYTRILHAL